MGDGVPTDRNTHRRSLSVEVKRSCVCTAPDRRRNDNGREGFTGRDSRLCFRTGALETGGVPTVPGSSYEGLPRVCVGRGPGLQTTSVLEPTRPSSGKRLTSTRHPGAPTRTARSDGSPHVEYPRGPSPPLSPSLTPPTYPSSRTAGTTSSLRDTDGHGPSLLRRRESGDGHVHGVSHRPVHQGW